MAVKGTKFKPMRVIPHAPLLRFFRISGVVLLFAVAIPVSYYTGLSQSQEQQTARFEAQAKNHQNALDNLTHEITQLHTEAEVDRQTIEDLRQLVMTQRAQLAASDRDLRVYKDLLSPGGKTNPLGISFGVFTVLPAKEKGHYSYSLTVQKLSTKEADFSGYLEFRVIGDQGSQTLQLSLYQVSAQVTVPSIPLSFKYFQTFDGEMTLPLDFVPKSVELVVKASDKKTPIIETQLEWPASSVKTK